MAATFPLERYRAADTVSVKVKADHLRFWIAAPEPVYLVVYIESADQFLAEDVRDLVERQWPHGTFYSEVTADQYEVLLRIAASATLDKTRVAAMLRHRSMRIDGPVFRGRPLGHRYDPIRSQIAALIPAKFERIVERLLAAHGFRLSQTWDVAPDLKVVRGRLYETLSWQSPAFAVYGCGADEDFRKEPSYESLHGDVVLIVDSAVARRSLPASQRAAIAEFVGRSDTDAGLAVIVNGCDLSGTGGLWRSTLRGVGAYDVYTQVRQLGLEAVTFLLLVTTSVYLDLAPEIAWDHVNYLH